MTQMQQPYGQSPGARTSHPPKSDDFFSPLDARRTFDWEYGSDWSAPTADTSKPSSLLSRMKSTARRILILTMAPFCIYCMKRRILKGRSALLCRRFLPNDDIDYGGAI